MIFDQEYTKLCSEKTLQANKEGFFLQFADGVAENVGEKWIKNVFGRLNTDRERIWTIYKDKKISPYVVEFLTNVQEIYRRKCPQTARNRLSEAESALRAQDKQKSLTLFSQSILKSPKSDQTLTAALLGRAKVLISLSEFPNALADLQTALKGKITDKQKLDAFWMMSVCYKALNEESKAQISLNLAEKLAGTNKKLLDLLRHTKYEPIAKESTKSRPIIDSHVSTKLEVRKSPEAGRYMAANSEVKVGEALVVEEAAVSCLLPEKFGTHCHHCFERFLAPLGCPDCSSVAFCGAACRDAAITTYHKYECKYLDLLIGSGMSVLSLTALRGITQQKLPDSVYTLCTNSDKRPPRDFLDRTLMAAFLLRCLQKSGYFGPDKPVVPTTEDEYTVGALLLQLLQILQFNAHEISETLYNPDHNLKVGKPVNIGVGVYPTVALFNHDCYPSVGRYFTGKKIVIRALRPLTVDSQISENYGPIFTCRSLIERQRALASRYWFNCRCKSCLEDWPMLNNASGFVSRVRCPKDAVLSTDAKCPKCQTSLDDNLGKLRWCQQQYDVASRLIERREVEGAIGVLTEALEMFHRVAAPPHRETHQAEEALRVCFGDFGNTYDCLSQSK